MNIYILTTSKVISYLNIVCEKYNLTVTDKKVNVTFIKSFEKVIYNDLPTKFSRNLQFLINPSENLDDFLEEKDSILFVYNYQLEVLEHISKNITLIELENEFPEIKNDITKLIKLSGVEEKYSKKSLRILPYIIICFLLKKLNNRNQKILKILKKYF